MIAYPVDVQNTRWAVYHVPSGEIVGRNKKWPVADGSEIQGADPDYVMLLQVKDAKPQYDSRLYTLEGFEGVDVEANVLHTSWQTVKRTTEEQIAAAENMESEQISRHINLAREVVETRLILGALLFYVIDAQQMPPKAQAMADDYKAKALKIWKNRDRLDAILDDINAGLEPDLDSGWESVE